MNTKDWNEIFSNFCKENKLTITHDVTFAKLNPGYVYLPHANPTGADEEHDNASRMIRAIIAHNNADKKFVADYKNKNQRRWFPVFEMEPTGLVFSITNFESWFSYSFAFVGAPFVLPTSEDAERIAKENLPIYIKLLQTI